MKYSEELRQKLEEAKRDTINAESYSGKFLDSFGDEWLEYSENERLAIIEEDFQEAIDEALEEEASKEAFEEEIESSIIHDEAIKAEAEKVIAKYRADNWELTSRTKALTGSIYLHFERETDDDIEEKEVRVSDHEAPANGGMIYTSLGWQSAGKVDESIVINKENE